MFRDYLFKADGETTYLICRVTSKELVIQGSCNFMSGSFSLYVITVSSLVIRGFAVVEI